jgi:cobalt-precorrin-5B (C1)-methyltransferase
MSEGRLGYTTGACAAAAAKAALLCLLGKEVPPEGVEIPFPNGERFRLPVAYARREGARAEAAVVKDAGDDPDITDGAAVVASVEWVGGEEIVFAAGDGVGVVTKPGLSLAPGEPAINPGPRRMIRAALREVTTRAVRLTVSIPGGRELAEKTFNPRLGIENGLSILGTTGRVRPFSCQALRCSVECALGVARACGVLCPVLVPGHIGERSARGHLTTTPEQVVEVGNEWGFVLERLPGYGFRKVLLLGHPGKLAKLAEGHWDTHSSRSGSPVAAVARIGEAVLGRALSESATTEGLFAALADEERRRLGEAVAAGVARAVSDKMARRLEVSVVLINMRGDFLGTHGELKPWR